MTLRAFTACLLPALAVTLASPSARGEGDRFDGDLALSAEAGAAFGHVPAGTVAARGLYLASAGVYVEGATGRDGYRLGAVGVEVRPLFIPRFVRNVEGSRDVLELAIDSLSLDLGASTRRGTDAASLELGGGFEVPFLGRYAGPFLAFHVFREISPVTFRGGSVGETRALFTLGFRFALLAHVVDAGDRQKP